MKLNLLLRERKLQLFCLSYILLPVPFISLIARNIPVTTFVSGMVVSIGLMIVIFILSSFMTTRGIRFFYAVLHAVTWIPGAILLGYLLCAGVLLSDSSITTLFETNVGESKEFIGYYLNPWITGGIALYILFPVVLIGRMKHIAFHRVREHKRLFAACLFFLFFFIATEPVARHIYFVDFYRVFADYKVRSLWEEKAIAARQTRPFPVALREEKAPQTMVLVIGESLSRRHMSLYGYGRNTNPRLSARRSSLKIYQDVVSPQVHTIPVMRSVLTLADADHPEYLTEAPSLFELFNRAGFETFLISNQPFDEVSSSYEPFLKLARHTIDLSAAGKPDEIILNALRQSLEGERRKLIVVHLMGNHTVYKFRYPPSQDYFTHQALPHPYTQRRLTEEARTIVNQYDNSVRYNDRLIASVLDLIDRPGESSVLIYFSDHGEEVYEWRNFAGHACEKMSAYMCEIPFIVWTSDSFRKKRKEMVFREDRPYTTEDLLYSLSDVAGIRYEGYDERRSLFSTRFVPRKRRVGNLPYESIRKSEFENPTAKDVVHGYKNLTPGCKNLLWGFASSSHHFK